MTLFQGQRFIVYPMTGSVVKNVHMYTEEEDGGSKKRKTGEVCAQPANIVIPRIWYDADVGFVTVIVRDDEVVADGTTFT